MHCYCSALLDLISGLHGRGMVVAHELPVYGLWCCWVCNLPRWVHSASVRCDCNGGCQGWAHPSNGGALKCSSLTHTHTHRTRAKRTYHPNKESFLNTHTHNKTCLLTQNIRHQQQKALPQTHTHTAYIIPLSHITHTHKDKNGFQAIND